MNPYIIFLPYAAIVPMNAILASIVSLPSKKNLIDPKIARRANIRIKIGIGLILVLISGFTLIIFILAANQKSSEKLPWVINFLKVIVQDSILSPFLVISQYFLIFQIAKRFKKSRFFGKLYSIIMVRYIEVILKGQSKKRLNLNRTNTSKIVDYNQEKVSNPENGQNQHTIPKGFEYEEKPKFQIR